MNICTRLHENIVQHLTPGYVNRRRKVARINHHTQFSMRIYKYAYRAALYWFVVFLRTIALCLPLSAGIVIGGAIGLLAYFLVPRYKRIAFKNLAQSFPEKPHREISSLTKQVFINQGKNLFELLNFHRLNREKIKEIIEFRGMENFKKAFSCGKGVLILSAHLGNWELTGAGLSMSGVPLNVVARKVYIEQLDRVLRRIRESVGMRSISRGEQGSAKEILRALKKNEALAVLIDQNTKAIPGVYVNFFGKKAYTPSGLAILALRTGASVVPVFIYRRKDNSCLIEADEPIKPERTGDDERDIVLNTQRFTAIIEEKIRQHPEQWVWFHERWD